MHISQLSNSKYLKQSDFPKPELLTIREITQENVARDDEPDEMKFIMHFEEKDKGMVLNSTNGALAARALGSEETDDWIGQRIVVYTDPNISFGGKIVGGLRVRGPKVAQPAAKPATPAPKRQPAQQTGNPVGDMDEDIPF